LPDKQKAELLAQAWFKKQENIPIGAVLQNRKFDTAVQGRLFTVTYFARPLNKLMVLISFYVLDNGNIYVENDQRKIANAAGLATENRFYSVMKERTEDTPSWFKKIEKASRLFDRRGIDAFAFVEYVPGERRLRIPIQIKSSRGGVDNYKAKHKLCVEHGVAILLINPHKTDEQVRSYVYNELGQVRNKKIEDGTRFTELHTIIAGHQNNFSRS
jgi:hypothetical protein